MIVDDVGNYYIEVDGPTTIHLPTPKPGQVIRIKDSGSITVMVATEADTNCTLTPEEQDRQYIFVPLVEYGPPLSLEEVKNRRFNLRTDGQRSLLADCPCGIRRSECEYHR